MKTKNIKICLFTAVLAMLITAHAARGQVQSQKEQEAAIEKYISQRQQEIEDYYLWRLSELRLKAEGEIRLLEAADRAAYAPLIEQVRVAKTVLHIHDYGYKRGAADVYEHEPYRIVKRKNKNAPEQFAKLQNRVAEKKNDVINALEWETVKLERQQQYALTTGLKELEQQLKANLLKNESAATYGVISGIVYSDDKPLAIIDGQIVREKDTIHNVRVVKINKDSIAFAKKDKRWEQKVQEAAKAQWQQR